VLLAEYTLFRVYAELLSKESVQFRNSLGDFLTHSVEMHDGCEFIRLSPSATDVTWFLQACLQLSMSRICGCPLPRLAEHVVKAASILRLSKSYGAKDLLKKMIQIFDDHIPQSYEDTSNKRELFENWVLIDSSHSIFLLDFFREQKLQRFIPWVLYLLSTSPSLDTGFCQQISLSQNDIRLVLKGKEAIQEWSRSRLSAIISAEHEKCRSWSCTVDLRSRWLTALLGSDAQLGVRARIEHFQALERGDTSVDFTFDGVSKEISSTRLSSPCQRCREVWLQKEKGYTMEFWHKIPTFYDLPTWFALSREK